MIVYPTENYVSFVSEDTADNYFEKRLHASEWGSADKEAALQTAFRSLQELDIVIDLTDSEELGAIQKAQMEQALWEIKHDQKSIYIMKIFPDRQFLEKFMNLR